MNAKDATHYRLMVQTYPTADQSSSKIQTAVTVLHDGMLYTVYARISGPGPDFILLHSNQNQVPVLIPGFEFNLGIYSVDVIDASKFPDGTRFGQLVDRYLFLNK